MSGSLTSLETRLVDKRAFNSYDSRKSRSELLHETNAPSSGPHSRLDQDAHIVRPESWLQSAANQNYRRTSSWGQGSFASAETSKKRTQSGPPASFSAPRFSSFKSCGRDVIAKGTTRRKSNRSNVVSINSKKKQTSLDNKSSKKSASKNRRNLNKDRPIKKKNSIDVIQRAAKSYIGRKERKRSPQVRREKLLSSKLDRFDALVSEKALRRKARGNLAVQMWQSLPQLLPSNVQSFVTGNLSYGRPTRLLPGLFVGDKHDANNPRRLQNLGITHVLNATRDIPNFHASRFTYDNVKVDDHQSTDLRRHFKRGARFIKQATRRGGRVLVHCRAGVSRSVTLCIAYLMLCRKMRLRRAHSLLQKRRVIICPNTGFLLQLAKFEVEVFGTSSVNMLTSPPWNFAEWFLIRSTLPSYVSTNSHLSSSVCAVM